MAGDTSSATAGASAAWRKRLLALFIAIATAGLIAGIVLAVKPDNTHANKASSPPPADIVTDEFPISTVTDALPKAPVLTPPTTTETTTTTTTPSSSEGTFSSSLDDASAGSSSGKFIDALNALNPKTGTQVIGGKAIEELKGFAAKSNEQMTGAAEALAGIVELPEAETYFNTLVKETSMSGGCTPTNGLELRRMLEDPDGCTIISLLPGQTYNVAIPDDAKKSSVAISSRKVVVGNPIALPTVDGSGCVRLFHVLPGGSLDLHFLRTFRGGGELIATIPVLRGGSVLVEAGGRLNAFGVIFTHNVVGIPPILVAPDLSRALRVFGGQVCVMGGIATITLSHFWTLQPGVMLRELYVIGAEMLTVAGVAVISGCTFTHSALFINGGGVGFLLAHLGGVLIASGMALTLNFMIVHAAGAGVLCFIGGGVGIFSGVTWTGNLGAYNHFGTGFNLFNGGGVLVLSGCVISTNLGVAAQSGTAIMVSLGGGTLTASGLTMDLVVGCEYYSGAGVLNWVGAGSAVMVGVSQSRSIGVGAVYGIGGTMAVGAGDLIVVGNANADNLGCASVVLLGGNYFLGAGVFVEIGAPMVKNAGVLFGVFLGFDSFVGVGTAVIAANPAGVNTGVAWLNKRASQYFINGQVVAANVSAFTTDSLGNVVPKKFKTPARKLRALLDTFATEALSSGADAVTQTISTATSGPIATSFVVLDGENTYNQGTPNDFVKIVREGPLGAVAARNPSPPQPAFASVNGGVRCNACGLVGDLASEITGESAGACANTQSGEQGACTLEGVRVMGANGQEGGPLPGWALQAGNLYDIQKQELTGLLDSQVVTATLRVGCSSATADCVQAAVLQEDIKQHLGSDCARANVQHRDQANHPALAVLGKGILPEEPRKLESSASTQVFDVAFTSHSAECTALVNQWVQDFAPSQLPVLQLSPQVEQAVLEPGSTYTAKGMDAAQAAQAVLPAVVSAMKTGAMPTVLVSGASEDGAGAARSMALPSMAQGGGATATLTGFVPGKPVSFVVTSKCLGGLNAADAPIGEFTPTEKGAVNVPFTVPSALAPGTYSVRAEQGGLGFCSQPFRVK